MKMKQKLKKSLVVGVIVLFIGIGIAPTVNPTYGQYGTVKEELVIREISTNNPRTYYNVNITIMSGFCRSVHVDGFHKWFLGYGNDTEIKLKGFLLFPGLWWPLISKIIVENDSGILLEDDLIYVRSIDIFNYSGWMSGHHLHFLLLVKGHCDKIAIYGYR
jgi:hypothetical protein